MRSAWIAAPLWLKVLCALGAFWFIGLAALGIALVFLSGPGLLLILLAGAGGAPWLALVLRNNRAGASPPTRTSPGSWEGLPMSPPDYARFRHRLVATMWDVLYVWPALAGILLAGVLLSIGVMRTEDGQSHGSTLIVAAVATFVVAEFVGLWRHIRNYVLDQGRTGYTYGKRRVGIRLVRAADSQPAGVGSAFGKFMIRSILTWLDVLIVLFDARRRCLGDMIVSTVVVETRRDPDWA